MKESLRRVGTHHVQYETLFGGGRRGRGSIQAGKVVGRVPGVPACDEFFLRFTPGRHRPEKPTTYYFRRDEALAVVWALFGAVYKEDAEGRKIKRAAFRRKGK